MLPSSLSPQRTGELEQEDRLTRFLYIVPEHQLAAFILDCFTGTSVALFIGLAADFIRSFTEMRVIDATSGRVTAITEAV